MTTGNLKLNRFVGTSAIPFFAAFAAFSLSLPAQSQNADLPTLSVISEAPNGLATTEKNTLFIKVFSWTAKAEPLEVRVRVTDWGGTEVGKSTQNVDFKGNSSLAVPVSLPKYGPYDITVSLFRPGTDKPIQEQQTRLIRPVLVPKLDAKTRAASWIGVNTHFNAPWESLGKIGVHWARDYSWGWLAEKEVKAPVSGNGVDFGATWKNADDAGVTILPTLSRSFYNPDKTGWIEDANVVSAGYETLAKAFPATPYWEVDNESEYGLVTHKVDVANYRRYLSAAAAGLQKAGTGAHIALTGTPGVFPEQASALLKPMAGAPDVQNDFAVVNYHYYTGNQAPETGRENINVARSFDQIAISPLDLQREINQIAHNAGKQAWLTETGWDVTNGPAVGEKLQAMYLSRVYLLSRWLDTDKVFWYFDRDAPGTGKFSTCGLFDGNWIARPSAAALAALSQQTALCRPAGSLDLGDDRWAVVLQNPQGGFVIGAWTVKGHYPAPPQLAAASAFDLFGNPVKAPELSPEVTYFHIDKLPAAWDAERKTQLLSRRLVLTSAGDAAPISVTTGGAAMKWDALPKGVTASAWKSAGDAMVSDLTVAPTMGAGQFAVVAIASGEGWTRRFPMQVQVRSAANLKISAYTPGEPLPGEVSPVADATQTITLSSLGAKLTPASGPASSDKPLAFSVTAPAEARGPLPLTIQLSSGARQTEWLRPRAVDVPRAQNPKIDAQLDETGEKARLTSQFFALTDADFAPETSLSWSSDGLILGVKMPVDPTSATDPQNFWDWTDLELFVDTDSKGQGWGPNARQFYFVPAERDGAWKLFGGEFRRSANLPKTTFDDARLSTAVRRENGQLYLEALIPNAALGQAPTPNTTWRAAVAMRRVSRTESRAEAIWPAPKTEGILDGNNWGVLHFAP